jgi:accessory gene regulator B
MVGLGYWATISIQPNTCLVAVIATTMLALYTIVKWVPADTIKRPITDEKVRFRQKLYMLSALCIWSVIAISLTQYGLRNYALAMVMGVLGSLFLITPWGYWLFETIDKILNRTRGGEANV